MPGLETVGFDIDTRPAEKSADSLNQKIGMVGKQIQSTTDAGSKGLAGLGASADRTTDSFERVNRMVDRNRSSIDSMAMSVGRLGSSFEQSLAVAARSAERHTEIFASFGRSTENVFKGLASATRGAVEFSAAVTLGAKAIATQATAVSVWEAALNRVRIARIGAAAFTEGLGGAAIVGSEIAAVLAIEKLAVSTYDRAKAIQQTALSSARTGFSFQDRSGLDFAAQRSNQFSDFFDSAAKSAGGVDALGKKLQDLAKIEDPMMRADAAFKQFGADADRILPMLGTRFTENIERAKDWAFTLDEVSRSRIDVFARDMQALKGTFDSFSDSVSASKQALMSLLQADFAGLYNIFIGGTGDAIGAVGKFVGNFTRDPSDSLKELATNTRTAVQGRQSGDIAADAQKEMLRTLTPAATKQYLKDQAAQDPEASLRADIARLQQQLFNGDITSKDYGQLKSGASFPGGYGAQALSLQKYASDQNELKAAVAAKEDAAEAKAAQKSAESELASLQKSIASGLQSAQFAELSGPARTRAEFGVDLNRLVSALDKVRVTSGERSGDRPGAFANLSQEYDSRFFVEGRQLEAESAAAMRERDTAAARSQDAQLAVRTRYTSDAILNTFRLRDEATNKSSQLDMQTAAADRDSQLRGLGGVDAKTLAQKLNLEEAKSKIETTYFERMQDLEAAGIDRGYAKQLADLQVLVRSKLISEKAYQDQRLGLEKNEQLDMLALNLKTNSEIQKSAADTAKIVREEYERQIGAIKSQVEPLFNTLFTHPGEFGKQLVDTLRSATLKPVIEGLSADVARVLQPVIYGSGDTSGGFSLSRLVDPLASRQSAQQDWSIGGATIQGALAGYSKFSGMPVYNMRGNKNGPLGDFDSESGRINMYAAAIKAQYSAGEAPWGAARTFIHEDTHALLDSKNIGALNALLPQDFVDKSIRGLVKSNHYSDTDAAREIIPRLVTNEETGASGFNQQKIFQEFIGTLRPQDARLADTLSRMGQAAGAIGSTSGDLPAINDLLRSTRTLNDYRISGTTAGDPFAPMGGLLGGGVSWAGFGGGSSAQIPGGLGRDTPAGFDPSTLIGGSGFGRELGNVLRGPGGTIKSGAGGTSPAGSGFGGMFSGIKGAFGSSTWTGVGANLGGYVPHTGTFGDGNGGTTSITEGGSFSDLSKSPADGTAIAGMVTSGGMAIAEHGLLGNARGTWSGTAQGTIGGFMVAGPIGAAVGFSIGIGEQIAGVESPLNKAKRLVKQIYNLNIDNKMAQQIVQLANQKYGSNVTAAVRDPDLRKELMVYAAGVGQYKNFPASSTVPKSGSLVEQNGQLFQQATYNMGYAGTFGSNLPVAGGISGSTYANPGTPINLSLNVNGQSASDLLAGQVVNTATPSFISEQSQSAMAQSMARVSTAATLANPGLIT